MRLQSGRLVRSLRTMCTPVCSARTAITSRPLAACTRNSCPSVAVRQCVLSKPGVTVACDASVTTTLVRHNTPALTEGVRSAWRSGPVTECRSIRWLKFRRGCLRHWPSGRRVHPQHLHRSIQLVHEADGHLVARALGPGDEVEPLESRARRTDGGAEQLERRAPVDARGAWADIADAEHLCEAAGGDRHVSQRQRLLERVRDLPACEASQ